MRITAHISKMMVSILVIGLLAVALSISCPPGVRSAFGEVVDGQCAATHSCGSVAAILPQPSQAPLLPSVALPGSASLAVATLPSWRGTAADVAPGLSRDPLNGLLRL